MPERKTLDGLHIRQRVVERLGCIKGCLEYLGKDVSFPWLYGGTGHAFIISLDPGVDVSSPDSWDHQPQFDLGTNLGYIIKGFGVWKPDIEDTFTQKQHEAWDFVRANLDQDTPCFGFELKAYYGGYWVINGYDEVGYFYSGWEEGGPLPWEKLGDQFVPLLEVRSVQLCDPAPDVQIVVEGLTYATKHFRNPVEWIDTRACSGQAAWTYWAEALETGVAKRDHHTYNAQLWLECRQMAAEFFLEAEERLTGRCDDLFIEAAEQYRQVCSLLESIIELHPERENPDWGPDSTFSSTEAAQIVRQAGEADERGIKILKKIVAALQ